MLKGGQAGGYGPVWTRTAAQAGRRMGGVAEYLGEY